MIIEQIHIINFGKLSDFTLELSEGINIIEGKNESGKSTVSAFIKFIFYGLSPIAEERARSVSWHSSNAAGSLILREGQDRYRIEREAVAIRSSDGKVSFRERCNVIDAETGKPLYKGKVPGEVFFGIPRNVFENTAFIGQLEGSQAGGRTLAEATENILFSADETVNTKKALKKLDEARVYLYHKNRKGGKIYEYSKERAELAEKLSEAQNTSAEIISAEGSLRSFREANEKATLSLDRVNGELAAYERYKIKQSYLRLRDESAKSENAEKALGELRSEFCGMNEDKFISFLEKEKYELHALETSKKSAENEACSIREKLGNMKDNLASRFELDDGESLSDLTESEEKAVKARSLRKNICIISVVCALLSAVGAVFFLPIAAVTAVFAVLIAVSFLKYVSAKKAALEIYEKLGVSGRTDFFAKLALIQKEENAISFTENAMTEAEEKALRAQKLYAAKKDSVSQKLSSAGFAVSENISDDIASAISEARASYEKHRLLTQEKETADANIRQIVSTLDGIPENEKEKAISTVFDDEKMKKFDLRGKKREQDFLVRSIAAQKEKIHSVECELASLNALHARPAEIAQSINALTGKIDELSEKFEAYVLAIDAINSASGKLRDGISPQIARKSSEILGELSDGKYGSVFVDSDFSMSYTANGMTRDVSTLSAGTSDIAYISLRIALAQTLCKYKMPPFIFDESFSRMDNDRLVSCLGMLDKTFSEKGQVIIFTCHERESKLAKNTIQATSLSI